MKVCVYFEPSENRDNFEGARLRKNIKGALEIMGIPYCNNIVNKYDLIHFISIKDEEKINDAIESHIPTVISAFMCENDITARITNVRNENVGLSLKAIRVLNKVDRVLVPNQTGKEFLLKHGITSKIDVVTPGVKLSRFEKTNQIEDDVFYRYYQLEKDAKFIVSIGTYDDKECLKALKEVARKCPKYKFFFFGVGQNAKKLYKSRNVPSNLKLALLMNDEVYCSMMKQASIYLSFDNSKHSPITLLDAASSKTQIVALEPLSYNEEILKETRAYTCANVGEVVLTIEGLMKGSLPFKVEEAYEFAKKNSLEKLGEELKEEYENIITEAKKK